MVAQSYSTNEILNMDLPYGTRLLDSIGYVWERCGENFHRQGFGDWKLEYGYTYQILQPVTYIKTPDWVTEEHHVVWAPFWARRGTSLGPLINVYESGGSWMHTGNGFKYTYGIDLDPILPPLPPAWEDPSGLTLEEARELAARLEEFDKDNT